MTEWIIFTIIMLAFLATAFWEAYIECENIGASKSCGWEIKISKTKSIKGYHVMLWWVTYPLLLSLPIVANPTWTMFRFVAAGYFLGSVLQDFMWFVVNPRFPFSKWNPKNAGWYYWLKLGKFQLPAFYLPYIIIGLVLLFV